MKLDFYLLFIYLFFAEIFLSVSYTWKNVAKMAEYHFLLKYIMFLPLFRKYLTIYRSFKIEVRGNWVYYETRVQELRKCLVSIFKQ